VSISSEEARGLQFSGSEHAYEAREVEEFRRRVTDALAAYESGQQSVAAISNPDPSDTDNEDLASAQRIRHQAVDMAERMLREVMGATGDSSGGLQTWQDAAMLRARAEEEMAFAREEARRLPAQAAAERDEMRARYVQERSEVRAELQRELQSSRAAAAAEAEAIRTDAAAEAEAVLKAALVQVEENQRDAAAEAHRMKRRIAVLHTALADAESRFRRLAATAANEVGTLAALADQDVADPSPRPDLHLAAVDLTDDAMRDTPQPTVDPEPVEPGLPGRDPEVGFYQRRLAGLRDRLEQSGHPPE
jgi:flagellar hook-basal body complex protein FliE